MMKDVKKTCLYLIKDSRILYICIDRRSDLLNFSGRIYRGCDGVMRNFNSKQELTRELLHIFDRIKSPRLACKESRLEFLVNPPMNLCIVELIGEMDGELHGRIDSDSKTRTRYFKSAREMISILERVVEEK